MTKYEQAQLINLNTNNRVEELIAQNIKLFEKLIQIEAKCDIIIQRTEVKPVEESAKVTSSLQLELEAFKELNKVKAELEALRSASGSEGESYNVSDFNGSI